MSIIRINDTQPFPHIPQEPDNRRESALDFFKRQSTGLKLISDEMEQEKKEQDELKEIRERSIERKQKLFYDNLDIIMRHKEDILATPRYANIDVHYAVNGGGLYVGHLQTSRQFNIAGSIVTVNLKLATLLRVWETDQFRADCECGSTAFIRSFAGSPLSGGSQATAYCPVCKKQTHVANRSFGKYFWFLRTKISEEVEAIARDFIGKWTLAEVEYEKVVAEGKTKDPRPGAHFFGDGSPCSLETMIQELKLKEFDEKTHT